MSNERFAQRHIGPREADLPAMLESIGVNSIDDLIDRIIPEHIRLEKPMDLPDAVAEFRFLEELKELGEKNDRMKSYIGMGYHNTITPPVIQRSLLENPGWYTAYTPYQAEISQGRLEALVNFQTLVTDLTGMELANASLLDEATAAAEAMTMLQALRSRKAKKNNANVFFVSEECHPQTIDVLRTRAVPQGIELIVGNHRTFKFSDQVFGALVQYPTTEGHIYDYRDFTESAHANDIKVVVAADLMSLVMLDPPGNWDADVVVGNTQRFGVPMGYGGPHAAYFATREDYKRQIPGRIIGVSKDKHGRPGMRMALQTREQHIRRDRATSNICTAQALLAGMASSYAVYHGPDGLRRIANDIHNATTRLAKALEELGYVIRNEQWFDTLLIALPEEVTSVEVRDEALKAGINFRYYSNNKIGVALDETVDQHELERILGAFANAIGKELPEIPVDAALSIPGDLKRTTGFLKHDTFNRYHSETEMMRYLKRLENRDISLTHSMIPLGSCTMKLNAASQLMGISWPEFANVHPFAPVDQTRGYRELFEKLESSLCEITGFAGISLQPNSGAQGEFTGLMVIRNYHLSRGDAQRNIALIPSSAHGTNPASASMAGMKVVVVDCDEQGNIELDDLRAKAEKHSENLAALMVTYPSTHGVFEEAIVEVNKIIHEHGGQVYLDGANMNAQVGLTNPAIVGADVCHLNLHKTFAIPHGGGGPGMGPIGVAEHLVPFLPGHQIIRTGGKNQVSAVSAAPWGSALILLISYAYIRMLGSDGLTDATRYAMLNVNYIKSRLKDHYNVLYTGKNGYVAHEMILDCREFKRSVGIEVQDIAKRLIDYGFHAPTVSFPVPGTMMVEPTESESKAELDRFCDAMIAIRKEIAAIEDGTADPENNVLKHAPHTAEEVTADEWNKPYSRKTAAYPLDYLKEAKYWVPVSRIDDAYGDRNLMCTCAPIEAYAEDMAMEE